MPWIGELLVKRGYVTEEQLNAALDAQSGIPTPDALGDTLVSMGYLSQRDKWRCLAEQWGVEYIDLETTDVENDVLKLVGQEICRRYKALPVKRMNGKVLVAMKDPKHLRHRRAAPDHRRGRRAGDGGGRGPARGHQPALQRWWWLQ
jgi:type IV pilus assembly protein PilB